VLVSAQHTPGTWRAESWTAPPACGATTVLVDDPSHFSGRLVIAECRREEDAAHIVRCVGAHDALMQACELAISLLDSDGKNSQSAIVIAARAAVASATGGAT
jgi:hypothetical protein